MTYCVTRVLSHGQVCTFEKLVVECFRAFPEHFSLRGFSKYPDSARVNKSWLRCRSGHGWILGSVKSGFTVSPAGEYVARSVRSRLSGGGDGRRKRPATRSRTREGALVSFVTSHPAYSRFLHSPRQYRPTDNELLSVCACTLDTPRRIIKQNLLQLIDAAKVENNESAARFIRALLERFQRTSKKEE